MKRIYKKIVFTVVALLCSVAAYGYDFVVDGIYYSRLSQKSVAVTNMSRFNSENKTYVGDLVIPQTVTYEGVTYTITAVGDSAFVKCWKLTSLKLPETVTSIGNHAFNACTKLTSVNIPKGVKSIGACAFSYCPMLTSITLPQGITEITDGMVGDCEKLTEIIIPAGVTRIGQCAFSGCVGLTKLNIPEGVTKIEYEAFAGCSALKSVTLPSTLKTIEANVFKGTALTTLKVPDGVTSIDPKAFEGSSITNLVLPEKGLKGSADGYEWVDLGLPSGTKWATCNVGAQSPDEYGDFFAWGETKRKVFYTTNKYNKTELGDIGGNPHFDAATANWGGNWRTPSMEQLAELKKYCTWEDATVNGQVGKKVISKTNYQYIFIPLAGYRIKASHESADSQLGSRYWSSTQCTRPLTHHANYLSILNGANKGIHGEIYIGCPIRPVLKKK